MSNTIHASAFIESTVSLGNDNFIGPYTVIVGNVTIGDGNWIGPHVTIGTPAQFSTKKFEFSDHPPTVIVIGSRNVIREYCTVHLASFERTVIQDDCYIMAYSHISHDTSIRSGAVLANNVQIGGFSEIQECANVGLSTVVHQFSTIGAFSMVGMGSVVVKDIPPFSKAVGNPTRLAGLNTVGMARNGFSEHEIAAVSALYAKSDFPQELSTRLATTLQNFKTRVQTTQRKQMIEVTLLPGK